MQKMVLKGKTIILKKLIAKVLKIMEQGPELRKVSKIGPVMHHQRFFDQNHVFFTTIGTIFAMFSNAKFSKFEFWINKVHFLSQVVSSKMIHFNPAKIEAGRIGMHPKCRPKYTNTQSLWAIIEDSSATSLIQQILSPL